ncbi:hypothetical protein [Stakelama tenebrarum]|uniref:Uncharacterized protein n=1 Tax=Stakelama tenebrarum TaxID=2711215 RepID=A0A6G6Y6G9_9SPHN|nr:hypothetical protein [Sphingosinithalassobacter tenebrarum]QIG80510.1 hypothetical protein G5C33_12445 [Sphingosinithalassobacter tenebrarum]
MKQSSPADAVAGFARSPVSALAHFSGDMAAVTPQPLARWVRLGPLLANRSRADNDEGIANPS